jgi:hypothetical protein
MEQQNERSYLDKSKHAAFSGILEKAGKTGQANRLKPVAQLQNHPASHRRRKKGREDVAKP